MRRRQTLVNAIVSVAHVVVAGGSTFILYRFLLQAIGAEKLGFWSVVVAATSTSRVADLGLAGGVIKFVAQYAARNDVDRVVSLVETAFLSLGVVLAAALLVLYPLILLGIGYVVPDAATYDVQRILPIVMVSFWLQTLGNVFQSGLDGCQRIDMRSSFAMLSTVAYVMLSVAIVPKYGLAGLAAAHLSRSLILLIGNWLLFKRLFPQVSLVSFNWSGTLFREILGYGINFQIISVLRMLVAPITKAWMARFGGLTLAGYYEMAYQMVEQIRAGLVAANSVIVPVVADLQERTSGAIGEVYRRSFKLLVFLGFPSCGLVFALIPSISLLWIGELNLDFTVFSSVTLASALINILSGPAYFTNLGTGKLRSNVVAHAMIALLNSTLGYVLGLYYGGYGVAVAWALARSVGSLYLILGHSRYGKVATESLVTREDLLLSTVSLLSLGSALAAYFYLAGLGWPLVWRIGITASLYSLGIAIPMWRHSMRGLALNWLMSCVRAPGQASP